LKNQRLATKQKDLFERQAANLQSLADSATDDARLVSLWRVETINAMIRLLEAV
jgi:hypothetical protein